MFRAAPAPRRLAVVLLLVALSVAAAGCLDARPSGNNAPAPGSGGPEATSAAAWQPDDCDPTPEARPSGNAPVLPLFREPPARVVERLSAAVGDPLRSEAPNASRSDERALLWETRNGTIVYELPAHGFPARVLWSGTAPHWAGMSEAEANATVRQVLASLDAAPDWPRWTVGTNPGGYVNRLFYQSFGGDPVHNTQGELSLPGLHATFWLQPQHDLSMARASLAAERAGEIASEYLRCVLDREGKVEEAGYELQPPRMLGMAVRNESLAFRVIVESTEPGEPSHCGLVRWVDVDALSGAVLARMTPLCD